MTSKTENQISGQTPQPLHVRLEDERKRRGWTQEEVAKRAGVPLRTYSSFANGHTRPQGANMRGILRAFDLDESAEDVREATHESWPADVEVFLDMMGAFLSTMDESARLTFMHEETRRIVAHRN